VDIGRKIGVGAGGERQPGEEGCAPWRRGPTYDARSYPSEKHQQRAGRLLHACSAGSTILDAPAGQHPGQCGQFRAVGLRQPQCPGLALEHGDLVAQDEDLGILGPVGPGKQGESAECAEYCHVDES